MRPGEKVALSVVGILVLAASAAVSAYMMTHRPQPARRPAEQVAPLVTVQDLRPTSHQVVIPALGTVIPALEVELRPRVIGEVVWTHPEFIAGGIVSAGEVLLRIDPVDYQLALTRSEANLESAIYEYKLEQGRQDIARREWELLGLQEKASELDLELALRQPHLREKEVRLEAAKAEVQRSKLDLERTSIRAPFNAVVRSTEIEVGGQASLQSTLAELAGTDAFRVQVSVPVDQLRWIDLPGEPADPVSRVRVQTNTGAVRQGRILKLLSDLEPQGRLARLLVEIEDPLDLKAPRGKRKPLLLGEYVRLEIAGKTVEDVFVVRPDAVRENGRVWLADGEGRLRDREVEVVWRDADNVLLRGLEEGQTLIVSDVPVPVEGMKLRINGPGGERKPAEGDGPDRTRQEGEPPG